VIEPLIATLEIGIAVQSYNLVAIVFESPRVRFPERDPVNGGAASSMY
jgi:hypothetical protein